MSLETVLTSVFAALGLAAVLLVFLGRFLLLARRRLGPRSTQAAPPTHRPASMGEGQLRETIVAQPGATVNLYLDGLPQASVQVRDHFNEGKRLQDAEQHEAAIAEFEKAFASAENDSQRCAIHVLIAGSFMYMGCLPEAEGHYRQALAAAEAAHDDEGRANALGGLGLVYVDKGELDVAERQQWEALAIHTKIHNRVGQATALGNLGNVYADRGDLEMAEEHLKKALAIYQEIGNRLGQAQNLGNLGTVYGQRGDPDAAEQYLSRALDIYQQAANRRGQAIQAANLGNVYLYRHDLARAAEHYRTALHILEQIGNRLSRAQVLGNLGLVHGQMGDAPQALSYLREARSIFVEVGASAEIQKTDGFIQDIEAASPPTP